MNRKDACRSLGAILGISALTMPVVGAPAATGGSRPNILVILADDLGYGELTCQGNPQIPTPHIDSIARNGIRFTNGYVTCPVSSPTRAGWLTGRYQQRFGFEFLLGTARQAGNYGLPAAEKTVAEYLKPAGYATGAFGKWHLGYAPEFHPMKRGFDEYFGFLGGAHDYLHANSSARSDRGNPIMHGTTPVSKVSYTTEMFGNEAAAFIEKHHREHWFVYLPFNAVHMPLEAPEKYKQRFNSIKNDKRRTYAGMESAMDDAVGVVLAKLREHHLEDNTLVFFFSDNGGPTGSTTSRNDPLSGGKTHVLEGGIREPFMVQWRGHLSAGKVDDRPIISLDILPTVLAAAGVPVPAGAKLEGVNLLPYLTGENTGMPHEALFWRYGERHAVRMGDWKLTDDDGKGFKLYNLAKDIGERHDLRAQEPAKFKELEAAFAKWNAGNIPPKWGNKGSRLDDAATVPGLSPEQALAYSQENDP
jgi:arylsulfatase A-like enzyme